MLALKIRQIRNIKENREKIKHALYNKPYTFTKSVYKPIIPCDIYQTWCTKDLPPRMKERVELLKRQNPNFNHYLFDDNDCREFIKHNFHIDVLKAYDKLIPGAYKADLWRLCVLFIKGGIYLDIKFACANGFKLIELTEKNHFVRDRPKNTIYNSLIASQKGNIFLLKAIQQIVINVKNNYYGASPLDPTGPQMLGKVSNSLRYPINLDMKHYINGGYIVYKNRFIISTSYPGYGSDKNEANKKLKKKYYTIMWSERNIYRK